MLKFAKKAFGVIRRTSPDKIIKLAISMVTSLSLCIIVTVPVQLEANDSATSYDVAAPSPALVLDYDFRRLPFQSRFLATRDIESEIVEVVEEIVSTRYKSIDLSDEDILLLAQMAYREARGEPFEGMVAVVEVALNRILSGYYEEESVREVLYARGQFVTASMLEGTVPEETQFEAVERAIKGPHVLPEEAIFFGRKAQNGNVIAVIGGHVFCGFGGDA